VLCTTAASGVLRREALGTCVGGSENVGERLRGLKVRFGEMRNVGAAGESMGKGIRYAGFGVEEETVLLKRKLRYGFKN
jgi:hypothetical protein